MSFEIGLDHFIKNATVKDFLLNEAGDKTNLSLSTDTWDAIEKESKEIFIKHLGKEFVLSDVEDATKLAMKRAIDLLNNDPARPINNLLVKQLSADLGRMAVILVMTDINFQVQIHRKRTKDRILMGMTLSIFIAFIVFILFYAR